MTARSPRHRCSSIRLAVAGALGLAWACAGIAPGAHAQDAPGDAPDREGTAVEEPDEAQLPEADPAEVLAAPAEPDEGPRRRIAVLVLATGELDPATADGLTEVLIGAVAARGGVTILGKEELQAQLGQGEAGTIECVSSMACLGRLGVQLAVVEVIAGTLARRGQTWIFNLNRVDVRTGELIGRVFREVDGDLGTVADALTDAIPELYVQPIVPGVLVVRARVGAEVAIDGATIGVLGDEPLRHEALAPGRHEVLVRAPGFLPWSRSIEVASGAELHLDAALREATRESVHPLVWIGAGVAAASLAAAIALGVSSQSTWELSLDQRSGEITRAEVVAYYDARELEAIAADVLFGVAGAAAIASLVALFFPEHQALDPDAPLSLRVTPGGLGLGGRF